MAEAAGGAGAATDGTAATNTSMGSADRERDAASIARRRQLGEDTGMMGKFFGLKNAADVPSTAAAAHDETASWGEIREVARAGIKGASNVACDGFNR